MGVIENMSGFVCPNCRDCTNIFSKGGGGKLAQMSNVPFLGAIPIDPNLAMAAETGRNFMTEFETSPVADFFKLLIKDLALD